MASLAEVCSFTFSALLSVPACLTLRVCSVHVEVFPSLHFCPRHFCSFGTCVSHIILKEAPHWRKRKEAESGTAQCGIGVSGGIMALASP